LLRKLGNSPGEDPLDQCNERGTEEDQKPENYTDGNHTKIIVPVIRLGDFKVRTPIPGKVANRHWNCACEEARHN